MENWGYFYAPDSILRSGRAAGADLAFERGCSIGNGEAEIFLPWPSYNIEQSLVDAVLDEPTDEAYEISSQFHPGWQYLKWGARKLHARNAHIVLGEDLSSPVDMVICWTPDGSTTGEGSRSGGTGQALRIAHAYDIDVRNLHR